jgi:hypothetical protein
VAALQALPDETLDRKVMISVRHDTRDAWPRAATVITIGAIPGEAAPPFLGLSGFADDHPGGTP